MNGILARVRSHPWQAALIALCAIALLKGLYGFVAEMSRQLGAPLYLDAKIYFAVGRGILNGLEPYSEIFESKTPVIFLITASSLLLTGDQRFANVLQVLVLCGIVASVFLFFRREAHSLPQPGRLLWQLAGLGLGLALGQYAALRAGYIQTESFGAFFGILYVFVFARTSFPCSWKRIALLGFLFFLSAGTKEPFAFVLLASVFVLGIDRRAFLQGFVSPGLIAGFLGLLLLTSVGSVGTYVRLYIPYMTQSHVYLRGSPWQRGFDLLPTLSDLLAFSPFLLLLVLALCTAFFLRRRNRRACAIDVAAFLVALYLTAFVVGLAGPYYPHHFVFPLPLYAALALVAWRSFGGAVRGLARAVPWTLMLLLSAVLAFLPVPTPTWGAAFRVHPEEAKFHAVADRFDALLDRCGFDRYLVYGWEHEDLTSRTRHSPYGSSFNSFTWGIDRTIPAFTELYVKRLNEAPIIVLYESRVSEFERELNGHLWSIFTRTPPECAKEYVPMGEYVFLFRSK